jgi:hypothetical protein
MKNAQRTRKLNTLTRQNYGSQSTIGPRQVAILFDIYVANQQGINVTLDTLAMRHPRTALDGDSFFALRARRLVKGVGRGWTLTPAGMEVARLVNRSTAAPGLGFVAIGMPNKRK